MTAPPLVRLRLRPALGRVLPTFLAAKERSIEEAPHGPDHLEPASSREVRAVDTVAIAEEGVEPEHLAVLILTDARLGRGESEVDAVSATAPRVPGNVPTHPLLVPFELLERSARREREAGVASVQVYDLREL